MYLLANMAILGSYVRFRGCTTATFPVKSNHVRIRYISGWKESQIKLVDGSVSRPTKTKKHYPVIIQT